MIACLILFLNFIEVIILHKMCNGEAMSACFTLETTEQISMKFGIEGFYVKL